MTFAAWLRSLWKRSISAGHSVKQPCECVTRDGSTCGREAEYIVTAPGLGYVLLCEQHGPNTGSYIAGEKVFESGVGDSR